MSKWAPRQNSDVQYGSADRGGGKGAKGGNRAQIRKAAWVARENNPSIPQGESPEVQTKPPRAPQVRRDRNANNSNKRSGRPEGHGETFYGEQYGSKNVEGQNKGGKSYNGQGSTNDWNDWNEWHEWDANALTDESEWADYVRIQDKTVHVDLSRADLGDQDLKALSHYLDIILNRLTNWVKDAHDQYILNIDLSMNAYITDRGVSAHLAPLLERWPNVHRLKLYKNCLGSESIRALSPWLSRGFCHELHMSDLIGPKVSADSVSYMLQMIVEGNNYPTGRQRNTPLWLRLEHNSIRGLDDILNKAVRSGLKMCLKSENCKPHRCEKGSVPHVHLVQFRHQDNSHASSHRRSSGSDWEWNEWYDAPGQNDWESQHWVAPAGKDAARESQKMLFDPKNAQKEKKKPSLTAADLLMGCASYDNKASRNAKNAVTAVPPNRTTKDVVIGKRMEKKNILETSSFPTLCPSVDSKLPASNLSAQSAWVSAPSAVFENKPFQALKKAPMSPPTGSDWPGTNAPAVSSDIGSGFGFSLPPPHKTIWTPDNDFEQWAAPEDDEQGAPMTHAADGARHSQVSTHATRDTPPPGYAQLPSQEEKAEVWRPLSHAEKEILKTHRKLRDIERIEEAMASGEKVEKNQLQKVQKKDEIASKLQQLEYRSRGQGGRTLRELEEAEKGRRHQEEISRLQEEKYAAMMVAATLLQTQARVWLARRMVVRVKEKNRLWRRNMEMEQRRLEQIRRDFAERQRMEGESKRLKEESEEKAEKKRMEEKRALEQRSEEGRMRTRMEMRELAAAEGKWKLQQTQRVTDSLPMEQWFYITPQGIIEGPFHLTKMQQWHEAGFFQRNLKVSVDWYRGFYALQSLFQDFTQCFLTRPCHPQMEIDEVVPLGGPIAFPCTSQEKADILRGIDRGPTFLPPETAQALQVLARDGQQEAKLQAKAPPVPDFPPPNPASPGDSGAIAKAIALATTPSVGVSVAPAAELFRRDRPPAMPNFPPPTKGDAFLSGRSSLASAEGEQTSRLPPMPSAPAPSAPAVVSKGLPAPVPKEPPTAPPTAPAPPAPRQPFLPQPPKQAPGRPMLPSKAVSPKHEGAPIKSDFPKEVVIPAPPMTTCPPMPRELETGWDTPPVPRSPLADMSKSSRLSAVKVPDALEVSGTAAAAFLKRAGVDASAVAMAAEETSAIVSANDKALGEGSPTVACVEHRSGDAVAASDNDFYAREGGEAELDASGPPSLMPVLPPPKDKSRKSEKTDKHKRDEDSGAREQRKKEKKAKKEAKEDRIQRKDSGSKEAKRAKEIAEEENDSIDDGEIMHEVQPLEQRFVGLVIGKAGETIKSFKKLTSCNIEIDQNLPEGMPRVIIYRGTRKQITAAKKMVAQLLEKTKEEEKARDSAKGPDGELLWRRDRATTRSIGLKKTKDDAPPVFGSLTGETESTGRPAWMSSRRTAAASEDDNGTKTSMLGGRLLSRESTFSSVRSPKRCGSTEFVYRRNLMLACRDITDGTNEVVPELAGICMKERPVVEEVKADKLEHTRSSDLSPKEGHKEPKEAS